MENKKTEGLFQISFFLGILFFVLTMFVIPNIYLMLIFLFMSVGSMTICIMLAVNERATRDEQKNVKSRVVPYL